MSAGPPPPPPASVDAPEPRPARPLSDAELRDALAALGAASPVPATLVLAGGAALALTGQNVRPTQDGDVIAAEPPLAALGGAVHHVAETRDLAPTWLNDHAAQFARFLPTDYRTRLVPVGTFGAVQVFALGRVDLILLKVLALRPQDAADLDVLRPTLAEWNQVRAQFTRIALQGSPGDGRRTVRANLFIQHAVSGPGPRAIGRPGRAAPPAPPSHSAPGATSPPPHGPPPDTSPGPSAPAADAHPTAEESGPRP